VSSSSININDVLNDRLTIVGRGSHAIAFASPDFSQVALRVFCDSNGIIDVSREAMIVARNATNHPLIPKIKRIHCDNDSITYLMPYYHAYPNKIPRIDKVPLRHFAIVKDKISQNLGQDSVVALDQILFAASIIGIADSCVLDIREDNVKADGILLDPVRCLVPFNKALRVIRSTDEQVKNSSGSCWKDRVYSLLTRWYRL